MDFVIGFIAAAGLAIWLYLVAGRGAFWLASERDGELAPAPAVWPRIVAVIPARDEAAHIGDTVRSLLEQREALDPLQVLQLERVMYMAASAPQTVPELVRERIAAETRQTETLYGFPFTLGGEPSRPTGSTSCCAPACPTSLPRGTLPTSSIPRSAPGCAWSTKTTP